MAGKATVIDRVEIDAAVDDTLAEDDQWNDFITSNPVPSMKVKGIVIPQPTKDQVDEWVKRAGEPDADKILMGEDVYAALQEAFRPLPFSAWRNFQRAFMNQMFGSDDVATLGK